MKSLKNIVAIVLFLLALNAPLLAQSSKASILTQIAGCFPDNQTGYITPALTRTCLDAIVNSYQQYTSIIPQTGSSYTIQSSDYGQVDYFTNSGAVAVTIPAASSLNPFNVYIQNASSSLVTITPASGTINGQTNTQLASGQTTWLISTGGTNWIAISVSGGSGGSGSIVINGTPVIGGIPYSLLYATPGNVVGQVTLGPNCVYLTNVFDAPSCGTVLANGFTFEPPNNANAIVVSGFLDLGADTHSMLNYSGQLNTSGNVNVETMNIVDTACGICNFVSYQSSGTQVFGVGLNGQVNTIAGTSSVPAIVLGSGGPGIYAGGAGYTDFTGGITNSQGYYNLTNNGFAYFLGPIIGYDVTAPVAGGAGPVFQTGSTSLGLYYGSGAPTVSAAEGSLYLRSDGAPYYNTTGSTTWAQLLYSGSALGTPSSATLTNATGLPISTGVSGLGTGVATALGNALNSSSGVISELTVGTTPVSGGTVGNTLVHGAGNVVSEIGPGLTLLGYADNVNFNATGDTAITLTLPPGVTKWRISPTGTLVYGVSGSSFSSAQVGVYSAASQGGTTLSVQQSISGITTTAANTAGASVLLTNAIAASSYFNFTTLYFNVGTAQGAAAVGNVYIYGYPLP